MQGSRPETGDDRGLRRHPADTHRHLPQNRPGQDGDALLYVPESVLRRMRGEGSVDDRLHAKGALC